MVTIEQRLTHMEGELVKYISKVGMLQRLIIDSLPNVKYKQLTYEQRQLVNYLISDNILDVDMYGNIYEIDPSLEWDNSKVWE